MPLLKQAKKLKLFHPTRSLQENLPEGKALPEKTSKGKSPSGESLQREKPPKGKAFPGKSLQREKPFRGKPPKGKAFREKAFKGKSFPQKRGERARVVGKLKLAGELQLSKGKGRRASAPERRKPGSFSSRKAKIRTFLDFAKFSMESCRKGSEKLKEKQGKGLSSGRNFEIFAGMLGRLGDF